ncbi:MAG: helix-turn-helix transcriptional regulator [Muribaculaceae bacterium]|jgi:regulator of cell morphogenesis and NO signaling|nr:helix-turn-helix transcriptional regulator [Muribaculaceae bacterium]
MLPIISSNTKLSQIIIDDPTILSVLSRFGISLGVGDMTIEQICQQKKMNVVFFTTILNTFRDPDFFPEKILYSFEAHLIVDYLKKTNQTYLQFQLPNIERHLHLLISKSDAQNSNLLIIMKFFSEVKAQLMKRIDDDKYRWFPEILALENSDDNKVESTVMAFDESNDSIEDKINDLISMFVVHLTGDYDINLGQAVLLALDSLKKDIAQNNRIRKRILMPLYQALASRQ